MGINRRHFGRLLIAGGGALAAGELVRLAGPRETMLFAQQSADYSEIADWFNANPGAGSQFNAYNQELVPYFNNINNDGYTGSDLGGAGDVAYSLGNYFNQTGSPTLDWCMQQCALANVPSPGSASSVLFTEPTSTVVEDTYSQAQNYGYNISYNQLAGVANVPNLSTWNTSNWFYPLCSYLCSSYLHTQADGLFYAEAYSDGGSLYAKQNACTSLGEAYGAIRAAAAAIAGLALDALGNQLYGLAGELGGLALLLWDIAELTQLLRAYVC
jgi:hypothetical protein